jgi:hypothetical protein
MKTTNNTRAEKIISHKVNQLTKNVYAVRVKLPFFFEEPTVRFIPLPKEGDKWFADIFIELKKKEV